MEEEIQDQSAGAEAVETAPTGQAEPEGENPTEGQQPEQARTFTRAEVNEIVQRRLERASQSFLKKHGFDDEASLDDARKALDEIAKEREEAKARAEELESVSRERDDALGKLAVYEAGILPERVDDAIAHFKGKGLQLTAENLAEAIKTHPEWAERQGQGHKTTIERVGATRQYAPPEFDEDAYASKLFGTDLRQAKGRKY